VLAEPAQPHRAPVEAQLAARDLDRARAERRDVLVDHRRLAARPHARVEHLDAQPVELACREDVAHRDRVSFFTTKM